MRRLLIVISLQAAMLGRSVPIPTTVNQGGLLQQSNLVYQGGFTVVGGGANPNFVGSGLCYDTVSASLYMVGSFNVANINIPTPIITSSPGSMNQASYLQNDGSGNVWANAGTQLTSDNFADPDNEVGGGNIYFGGCGVLDASNLLFSFQTVYTNVSLQRITSWKHAKTPLFDAGASMRGYYSLIPITYQAGVANSGYSARDMGNYAVPIPANYKTSLGGDLILGMGLNANASNIQNISQGPSAFVVSASAFGNVTPGSQHLYTVNPVLDYPYNLGNGAGPLFPYGVNGTYGSDATHIGGVVFVPEHHTFLVLGDNGIGTRCYGNGVSTGQPPNPPEDGQTNPPGSTGPNGTNASTTTGSRVFVPNANLSNINSYIWLSSQTSPVYPDNSAPGLALITATANSGNASAYIDVTPSFPANLSNQTWATGEINCYDPENATKGPHSWPTVMYAWAYDLNDLVAVKNGTKLPSDLRPYATWNLNSLMNTTAAAFTAGQLHATGGVTDAYVGIGPDHFIYWVQMQSYTVGCCEFAPIVHKIKIL